MPAVARRGRAPRPCARVEQCRGLERRCRPGLGRGGRQARTIGRRPAGRRRRSVPSQRAEVQQLMPVRRRARQSRGLERKISTTSPRATSATNSLKPKRPSLEAPERSRSRSTNTTDTDGQLNSARSRSAYWRGRLDVALDVRERRLARKTTARRPRCVALSLPAITHRARRPPAEPAGAPSAPSPRADLRWQRLPHRRRDQPFLAHRRLQPSRHDPRRRRSQHCLVRSEADAFCPGRRTIARRVDPGAVARTALVVVRRTAQTVRKGSPPRRSSPAPCRECRASLNHGAPARDVGAR